MGAACLCGSIPPVADCLRCAAAPWALAGHPVHIDRMIVCPTCGNKRCPKATDHDLPCSGSNEPGQAGSAYQ